VADLCVNFADDGTGGYSSSYGNSWQYKNDDQKLDLLIRWVQDAIFRVIEKMRGKKRHDTQVYQWLQNDLARYKDTLKSLAELLEVQQ
jgi:hypothetical protein